MVHISDMREWAQMKCLACTGRQGQGSAQADPKLGDDLEGQNYSSFTDVMGHKRLTEQAQWVNWDLNMLPACRSSALSSSGCESEGRPQPLRGAPTTHPGSWDSFRA